MVKILFTGGGTGGHIFPLIALIREIRRLAGAENVKFFYVGPRDDFGEILFSQENIKIKNIFAGKIRRYFTGKSFLENLLDIFFKIPLGILQSFFYLFSLSPDLIISKGGFGSVPGTVSGWLLGTPVFLHESDVAPGLASRFLSVFAKKVFVSFPDTEYFSPKKMVLIGNPIRRELLQGSRETAANLFKLAGQKPIILILGGSQGSQRINDRILEILNEMLKDFEILHQCGEKNFEEVKAESKAIIHKELEADYHLFPLLKEEELKQALAAADLVISRAGSGSIFEIAALGKPSILVPLPESAQNHQVLNAYKYAEKGASIVLEEGNFTSHFFLEKLKHLFGNHPELEKMAKAAKEFSKPDAARTLAEYLLNISK